jgi:hypothetical protein
MSRLRLVVAGVPTITALASPSPLFSLPILASLVFLAALAWPAGRAWAADPAAGVAEGRASPDIRAFCVDFNWWGPGGFAPQGTFADADPAKHVAWYRALGANVIQTFCVSCDGHSWYRGHTAPVQPGMKGDFLRDMVRLGHDRRMRVMGYFCVGANRHWGATRPELSHGAPSAIHIPLSTPYLDYLCAEIREAVATGIDGFMLDWFFNVRPGAAWLACEKQMYAELFGKDFPGETRLGDAEKTEFCRRAVDRAWKRVRQTAKAADPKCILWLSSHDLLDPQQARSVLLREVDWLMSEGPNPANIEQARRLAGRHATVIQCVCGWGKEHSAGSLMKTYANERIGFYGFAYPWPKTCLPPEGPELDAAAAAPGSPGRERLAGNAKNIAQIRSAWTRTTK